MSETWRAFISPIYEDQLGITKNNKQDISSFVLSSGQTPQQNKQPSNIDLEKIQCTNHTLSNQYYDPNNQKQEVSKGQQIDVFDKFANLKKKIMSVSLDQYNQNVPQYTQQKQQNDEQKLIQQSSQKQFQDMQEQMCQLSLIQISHLQSRDQDKLHHDRNSSQTGRSNKNAIKNNQQEFTQHSTTNSISNKNGFSQNKKSSFLEDIENNKEILAQQRQNFEENEHISFNQNNKENINDTNIYIPKKEEQNETEMLKRCLIKIQQKLDKEKQKRKQLEMIITQSNKSLGSLRQEVDNYQLDMELVKYLQLNTQRAMETRSSSSSTVQSQNTNKNKTSNTQKKQSKSKEKLSNMIEPIYNKLQKKSKRQNTLKVFRRKKSKSVSSTINDFNQKQILNDIDTIDSSKYSSHESDFNELKNQGNKIWQSQNLRKFNKQKSCEQNQGEIKQNNKQSYDAQTLCSELKQIRQPKMNKQQFQQNQIDKNQKELLNLGDVSSSQSSEDTLELLQLYRQQQNQIKFLNQMINTSNDSQNSNQNNFGSIKYNMQTQFKTENNVSYSHTSLVSSASEFQQPLKNINNKSIIQNKLNEFKELKKTLNTNISDLKKEFQTAETGISSLNTEKLKDLAKNKGKLNYLFTERRQIEQKNINKENTQNEQESINSDNKYQNDDNNVNQNILIPISIQKNALSNEDQLKTNKVLNFNQSYCNSNQRSESQTPVSESHKTASFERQRLLQSKNNNSQFCPSYDILSQNSQANYCYLNISNLNQNMFESFSQKENNPSEDNQSQSQKQKDEQENKIPFNQFDNNNMTNPINNNIHKQENLIQQTQIIEYIQYQQQILNQQPNYEVLQQLQDLQVYNKINQQQQSQTNLIKNIYQNQQVKDSQIDENKIELYQKLNRILFENNQSQLNKINKQNIQNLKEQDILEIEAKESNIQKQKNQITCDAQNLQHQTNYQKINKYIIEQKQILDRQKNQNKPHQIQDKKTINEIIKQNKPGINILQQIPQNINTQICIQDYSTNNNTNHFSQNQQSKNNKKKQQIQQNQKQIATQPHNTENQNKSIIKQIKRLQYESLIYNQNKQIQE